MSCCRAARVVWQSHFVFNSLWDSAAVHNNLWDPRVRSWEGLETVVVYVGLKGMVEGNYSEEPM